MNALRGILGIIAGGVMLIGGLTGNIVLKGTQSGGAAAAVGAVVLALSIARLATAKKS
jgi:hypothetical protein